METYKVEKQRQEEVDRLLESRKKVKQARTFATNAITEDVPAAMVIEEIKDDGEMIANIPTIVPKRLPARKTKQQCARMAKQKAGIHLGDPHGL